MIHKTAEIFTGVEIEDDVYIGPFCVIGGQPEDKKYFNQTPPFRVKIKSGARISSMVTIDSGTIRDTVIGKNSVIFAHSHVAHDCILEDDVIVGGSVSLAGHTYVQKGANISGKSATVPYCVIGAYSFLGAASLVTKHVAPGQKQVGFPAKTVGINEVGLHRAKIFYISEEMDTYRIQWAKLVKERPLL